MRDESCRFNSAVSDVDGSSSCDADSAVESLCRTTGAAPGGADEGAAATFATGGLTGTVAARSAGAGIAAEEGVAVETVVGTMGVTVGCGLRIAKDAGAIVARGAIAAECGPRKRPAKNTTAATTTAAPAAITIQTDLGEAVRVTPACSIAGNVTDCDDTAALIPLVVSRTSRLRSAIISDAC
ncbi:MAG: hypothetical protein DMG97_12600 [Acidobacteria bacterium]|nr:MAG: hypothetical protein DMG97_12600 [Acidobacteriota bacterium]